MTMSSNEGGTGKRNTAKQASHRPLGSDLGWDDNQQGERTGHPVPSHRKEQHQDSRLGQGKGPEQAFKEAMSP